MKEKNIGAAVFTSKLMLKVAAELPSHYDHIWHSIPSNKSHIGKVLLNIVIHLNVLSYTGNYWASQLYQK